MKINQFLFSQAKENIVQLSKQVKIKLTEIISVFVFPIRGKGCVPKQVKIYNFVYATEKISVFVFSSKREYCVVLTSK